ncbi:bifunctional ADP-dependent NAD(P)H-hydrate dehydratase/NAD(P)H-hydrate epimerase [Desulfobacter hydrogenophilus]|uniref:Bifunctional NAD(P)H-hydrate repair enzyme n=1 Tax=Desulfobacter hydrogenophilus TaxID=2291 RepID=A0A328FDH7_9BACT|nr:NAD(P)H-hydrate dehydratase [Desulfobacter hydrogenophilus]NDY72378.1 NAD(P)H-hydrate dehydratase [Desulfobacter hydrogenophilus]QBH13104.1 NAD(P)H-hydrate dehydratase [Desulfobacter hydrogenophilus]RAM01810.1 bifunctional ADP-dependent NAD(P)H-hydrate dehydratase/NAD(P)H-hydrate epimerase [Desulfobacter hydrogenophilus]
MIIVTTKQMQQMDKNTIETFGIPGRVLMENAGRGALEMLSDHFDLEGARVAVVAGRGNNGGDGFVIGRYLMEMGVSVSFFLLSTRDRIQGDARANMDLVLNLLAEHSLSQFIEIPDKESLEAVAEILPDHDLFVDAIFGTGLNSDVRGIYRNVIELINDSGKSVFSVDIPSGINADTGAVCGVAIQADATATFAFAKTGHILYPGNFHTGDLEVIDIGIPGHIAKAQAPDIFLPETHDIAGLIPTRDFNAHKGSSGHLLVLAGSPGKTGAAALCANAAMRTGAGLVTLGVPENLMPVIEPMVIEPMTTALAQTLSGGLDAAALDDIIALLADKAALAIGPGMGTDPGTRELIKSIMSIASIPMVIDADALNCIAKNPDILDTVKAPVILTPHPGEMARLTGKTTADIQRNRMATARNFAEKFKVILVLKGAQTLVACPDGTVFICPTGNPGMACGGMGDVLTGIIAAFLAQNLPPESAALAGVYIHGLCGDLLAEDHAFGFSASDMVAGIPQALNTLLS